MHDSQRVFGNGNWGMRFQWSVKCTSESVHFKGECSDGVRHGAALSSQCSDSVRHGAVLSSQCFLSALARPACPAPGARAPWPSLPKCKNGDFGVSDSPKFKLGGGGSWFGYDLG